MIWYRNALTIREQLSSFQPDQPRFRAALAVAMSKLAKTLAEGNADEEPQARALLENGRDILRRLEREEEFAPDQRLQLEERLEEIEHTLKAVSTYPR